MIFVTGGCFQGKQQWVLQNCQVQPFRVADGAVCSMEAIKSAGVLDHFHLLVRRWMQAGKIPADETEKILSDNPDIVIITDEIGSGIVPLDVKEREWRKYTAESAVSWQEGPMLFFASSPASGKK